MNLNPERGGGAPRSPSRKDPPPALLQPAKKALVPDPIVEFNLILLDASASSSIDDLDRASKQRWETSVEPTAQHVLHEMGMLDPTFNAAFYARVRGLESNPYVFPSDPERDDVRQARMVQGGLTWRLDFVISEVARLINIVTIEPEVQLVKQLDSDLEATG